MKTDSLCYLVDDQRRHYVPIQPRTAAIVKEILSLQERIEGCRKGRLEIVVDFTHGSITPSLREVLEARRIE